MGMLRREPWARIVALVLGFISLFLITLGLDEIANPRVRRTV